MNVAKLYEARLIVSSEVLTEMWGIEPYGVGVLNVGQRGYWVNPY